MNVYNRFDAAKNYEQHEFLADRVLQSAELNEMQANGRRRVAELGNVLFRDGSLIRDAACTVDGVTGETRLQSGALWLAGAVRGIGPATFTIPVTGTVVVGVYLQTRNVTELDDPSLLNPAVGTRGYQEPGAHRLQLTPVWGYAGDGKAGEFYAVYEVVDGNLKVKEPPPNIDAVNLALQRYDRDSTGGSYIINGLEVRKGSEFDGDKQTYLIAPGAARANGKHVELRSALRYVLTAAPEQKTVIDEPHLSKGVAAQRVNVDRSPIAQLGEVVITVEKTVSRVHGVVTGSQDPLPDSAVRKIVSVTQGATTYVQGTDYKLTSGKVDWSLAGAEPLPGSTYQVTYQHNTVVTPTNADSTGFTVTGAVADTDVSVSYSYKVPRVDRLCLNDAGDIVAIKGVASDWMPPPPSVPADLLLLATVYQKWNADTVISADAPRMVPMADLANVQKQLDGLKMLIAQQALTTDAMNREAVLKKGVSVDPFLDDSGRDGGVLQNGAIVGGALTLPIALKAARFGADVAGPTRLAHKIVSPVEQPRRTGSMHVNPYQSFAIMPASITLDPAVDQMTYPVETWSGTLTSRVVQRLAYGASAGPASSETTETVSTTRNPDQVIRPAVVSFALSGFAAGEKVQEVSFDGVAVKPWAGDDQNVLPVADAQGKASGKFSIPPRVPVGRKLVAFVGGGGSYGSAYYTAASWTEDRVLRRVVTEYAYEYDPPPPPPPRPADPPVTSTGGGEAASGQDTTTKPKPPETPTEIITGIYENYFGRKPDTEGLMYWTDVANTYSNTWNTTHVPLLEHMINAAGGVDVPVAAAAKEQWEKAKAAGKECYIDPLAQTFVLPAAAHLVGVDLWFEAVGPTDVIVQLRAVENGVPVRKLRAESRLAKGGIKIDGSATRVLFDLPYYAQADEELAVVVMCNDAETALAIAELGKHDGAAWVTAQPYTVGVLLSSSNNLTWTAHQDRDLRFRVLAAEYTETERVVDLGKVAVKEATDLMVLGLEEKPGARSSVSYTVTLPDGSEIAASSHQPLTLPAPITGDVKLKAHLRGDATASPVLHRGGQLMVGWLGDKGDYVGRAVPAGQNSRVRVIVDALLPTDSGLTVKLKGADEGDTWSAAMPQINAVPLDNGLYELTYEQTGVNEAMVQAKLELTGVAHARPFIHKLRVMVM